ncbi:MAG: hypothetical protein MR828_03820, partial [Clostridiales bacterium]|nr:hypothetical protein [Clostridiales bacterium]
VVVTLLGTARFVFARRDWIMRHFSCAETLPGAAQESRISHQPGAPLAAGPARQITIYQFASGSRLLRFSISEWSEKRKNCLEKSVAFFPDCGIMVGIGGL